MFIKRDCLNEVGDFDEANFGMGYGEECDFSMRALARGWKHVIAADVFVFHEGAVSFAAESEGRKLNAERIMQDLHPEYEESVRQFIQDDSLWDFRSKVDSARVVKKPEDSANILAESARHQSILKERVADLYEILQSERAFRASQEIELRRSLEKSVWLEQELARQGALTDRQNRDLIIVEDIDRHQKAEIESLTTLLEHSRAEFSKTDEALAQVQRTTTQLGE